MSHDLTLHELTGSPNSVKVRIALGYKGLEYERKPIPLDDYPGDRSAIVELSRQPRLPVLRHGTTTIFDSGAIIRYLEANFPDTPPLFVHDHAVHREIENWELFARTRIGEAIGLMFNEAFGGAPDPEVIEKANRLLNESTATIEQSLGKSEFLVGDHLTAADVVCASPLYLADMSDELGATSAIAGFFQKNLALGEGRETTRAWIRRVLAYDAVLGRRPTRA